MEPNADASNARIDKEALFDLVGYRPHEGQLAVHRSDAERRVLACGVRWGKSTVCVHEALAALLAPGLGTRGWIVTPSAPTTRLLTDHLFALVQHYFAHRVVELDEAQRRLRVRNLGGGVSTIEGKTADRPAGLLGASLSWLIVDEAARLREEIWTGTLTQRLVDQRGWALIASTPKAAGDWFHREHLRGVRGEPGYASWTGPTWDNPAIDQEEIVAEKARIPAKTFQSEYGGRFVGEHGAQCQVCGWGREFQKGTLTAREWAECRRCDACLRPLTASGEPFGYEDEDGGIGFRVLTGPGDDELLAEARGRLGDGAIVD